jgi:hypothetical protein
MDAFQHQQTLRELAGLDFTGKGEAFVEQKFVTPLLECLGYESHKDYEVYRHGDEGALFKLQYPPVEHGAVRVKHYNPDYVPTIRKKAFWIIEAKSPKDVQHPFDKKYVVQGLQYCIHPEIQARYLLLTTGAHSAVYDAHASVFFDGEMYEPILEFSSSEIVSRWEAIYGLLSVEKLRGRLEADLKAAYDKLALSSLDERYPQRLLYQVGASQREHSKTIERHVNKLWAANVEQAVAARRQSLESMTAAEVYQLMDQPFTARPTEGSVFLRKSLDDKTPHAAILDQLTHDFEQQSIFRKVQSFDVACSIYQITDDASVKEACRTFLDRYKSGELQLLNQVECAGLRVFRKLAVLSLYPDLRKRIESYLETAPEMVRFVERPAAFAHVFPFEIELHDRLFAKLKRFGETELTRWLNDLLKIEQSIETAFVEARSKLSDSERQIGGFETYGVGGSHYAFRNMLRTRNIEARPDLLVSPSEGSRRA